MKKLLPASAAHTRCQKKRVPEEGKIGRTYTIFDFLHAFHAPSRSAYPRDAVSAAGPLCTHGKDKPGLGAPNSLKLIIVISHHHHLLSLHLGS